MQVFDQIGERLLKCSADDYMSSIRGMGKAEAKYSLDNRFVILCVSVDFLIVNLFVFVFWTNRCVSVTVSFDLKV